MPKTVHVEVLDLMGAQAFVDVLAKGRDAMGPVANQIINLACTAILSTPHGMGAFNKVQLHRATLHASIEEGLAKGLLHQGEKGMKDAARQGYASIFPVAGFPEFHPFCIPPAPNGFLTPGAEIPKRIVDKATREVTRCIRQQLGASSRDIESQKRLREDLGADSLDLVELTMAIEDGLRIELEDTDAQAVITVQDTIDLAVAVLMKQESAYALQT